MIKFFEKHNKISWAITILIAIFIFYISSLTFESRGGKGFGIETVLYHFIVFFFLTFFLLISLINGKKKNTISLAIIVSIIYAISDEVHQLFVSGRDGSIKDVLIDSAGIFLASFLYILILKLRKNIRG